MSKAAKPLALDELFAQFVQRRAAAWQSGVVSPSGSEVELYQAAALYLLDPRTALDEALESAKYLTGREDAATFRPPRFQNPPGWADLVRGQENGFALPFSLASFPQAVSDVTPLIERRPLADLAATSGRATPVPELAEWGRKMAAKNRIAETLFAAAALRLARQWDETSELLGEARQAAPATWEPLLLNEEAALVWSRGEAANAADLWNNHPQRDNPVILFNRGLVALFGDRLQEAAPLFARAAEGIPEQSGWHHLARLYQTLAEAA